MSSRGLTVLIVDDIETLVMYASLLIRRMGFKVLTASNGMEALQLIKSCEPDIVLLDNQMPKMTGIEVLEHMRDDETIKDVQVIMLSLDANPETHDKCMELGCVDFLTKPLQIKQFHRALEKCVELTGSQPRRHLRADYPGKISLTCENKTENMFSVSISEGGIFIRATKPLPVDSEVELTIPLQEGESVTTRGKVVYIKGIYGELQKISPGMGIEFTDISPDDNARISVFVKKLLAGDIMDEQSERKEDIIKIFPEDN